MEAKAREIVRRLRDAGHVARYAGGCVRDMLMGQAPQDYDIATSARPDQVVALFPRTVLVGVQFGVVRVMDGEDAFEVATFRSDGAYVDGRHPEGVAFSSPEEDARRRDFTINGIFYDPLEGEFIDLVGGRADIEAGVVRAIGNPARRFEEDHLRLLRAVRFSARFGYAIEAETMRAIEEMAPRVLSVSPERIRAELVKMMLHSTRAGALDLLHRTGLLREILPEVEATVGCEQPPEFHPEGDVYTHTRIMLDLLGGELTVPLVFGVLFHDIGKPPTFQYDEGDERIRFNGHDMVGAAMTEEIMRRLRFSNEEIRRTVDMVRHHMGFKDVQKMRTSTLKRFMSRDTFDEEMELHRVDCESSHGMLDNLEFLERKREEFAKEPLIPPPLVTGQDLIAMGLAPSPLFGKILSEIQTRQLDGSLTTREEALAFVEASLSEGGGQATTSRSR